MEESRRWQSLFVLAARAVSGLLGIGVPLVLVRVFDQTVFGEYRELFLIAGTASSLFAAGLPASLYFLVPRFGHASQTLLVQSTLLLGLLGLVCGVTLLAAGPVLQGFFHARLGVYIPWLALFSALSLPVALLHVAPMVDRRSRLAALLLAGFDTVRSGVLILVAVLTRDLTALLAAASAVMGLQCTALLVYLVWRGRRAAVRPQAGLLRVQLGYALPFAGAALVGLFRDKLHAYYVGGTVTPAEFAIYAVGLLQIPFIEYLGQTVGEVLVLENSANYAARQLDEMRRIWHRAAHALALVLLPLFAIAEVFAPAIIHVLFGEAYTGATSVFRVHALTIPLALLLASPLLRSTGDLRMMLWADLASLVVAVGTLALLAGAFGTLGAVGSLVAGSATFALVASHRNAARLELPPARFLPWGGLARVLVLSFAAALTSWIVLREVAPVAQLLGGGTLALLVYGVVAWRSGLVPASERDLVCTVLARVSPWPVARHSAREAGGA